MSPRTQPERIGQGILDLGDLKPATAEPAPQLNLDHRIASSRLIKLVSESVSPDPSELTERDVRMITPDYLEAKLYVKTNHFGRSVDEVPNAYNGVVFPLDQFLVVARSPRDLAKHAKVRAEKSHASDADKEAVDALGNRAAGHELEARVAKIEQLHGGLVELFGSLRSFSSELHSGKSTGYSGRYKAQNLLVLQATALTAIDEILSVTALSRSWDKEQFERAKRTVRYQLNGERTTRVKNWNGYVDISVLYARARMLQAKQSEIKAREELAKYQPFLDNAT